MDEQHSIIKDICPEYISHLKNLCFSTFSTAISVSPVLFDKIKYAKILKKTINTIPYTDQSF